MDSWNKVRPHYHSHEDLAQFEPLNTPLWVFDVDRHAMWWANSSALVFWRAESLKALLARDYSSDSETVRTRLRQVVESPTGTSRIQEIWTLYPEGVPTTVIADQQPVLIEGGRHAILIEASRVLDLQEDPDALRILEVARYSALMVSSFTMSGRLLTQNPTSLTYFGHPVNSSSRSDLAGRFIDETIAASILATVEREGHFEAEVAVCTAKGERTNRVLARKGRDPVTGEFVTVLNEEDMTEQAALRCRLQRLNNELELRVVERTLELREANEALTHEMSEHKRAEEALKVSEEAKQALLTATEDSIFLLTRDGTVIEANPAGAERLGTTVEDILGKSIFELMPPDVGKLRRAFLARLDARESIDFQDQRAGMWFENHVHPVSFKDGKVERFAVFSRDITERQQLEVQLREAHKLKALGQVTGGVAHEFNNLLQAIVGSLDVMLKVIEDGVQDAGRAKHLIKLAQRSAFSGKELTGRLLSYVGKHPVTPNILNVGEFVNEVVGLLLPTLGEMIEIDAQIASDLWPIKVDREQLELALLNLALNARDSMADGGKLTIEAANANIEEALAAKHHNSATPGDYVKLAITDTGTGMSPEVRDQVFDPFFTTKEVGKGTGLGLSMVYGFIVRQSGGLVDITSAEGRGTTVVLYLPRAEAKKAEAPQPAEGSREPSTGAGTILVVEDNPAVLHSMVFMLEVLGYTALKAKDAAEALTVLQQAGVIDLLLVDMILPGGTSGIELAENLRSANSAIKVIMMSGYSEDKYNTTALSEAGIRLLKKPFGAQTLASAIEEALEKGSKHAA